MIVIVIVIITSIIITVTIIMNIIIIIIIPILLWQVRHMEHLHRGPRKSGDALGHLVTACVCMEAPPERSAEGWRQLSRLGAASF